MTILIVNRDLGYTMWLGSALCDAGHSALPATSVREARSLQRKLDCRVDILVVEPYLVGSAALVEGLRQSNPDMKVLKLADSAASPSVETLIADEGLSGVRPTMPLPNVKQVLREILAG